ncbi:MAG: polysaccharide deacetylase family protein [Pseudomonadota bacterium]
MSMGSLDHPGLLAELEALDAPVPFWWRDDDAVADTPELDRLLALADRFGAPVILAVIPANLTPGLAPRLRRTSAKAAVHGWSHKSHAPEGEKNAEFRAHRPLSTRAEETARGLAIVRENFGPAALLMFVPPWNRIAEDMAPALAEQGYRSLSTFGARPTPEAASGVAQVNAHLDPIDWRGTRSLVDPNELQRIMAWILAERRTRRHDPSEPFGLLTHHLVHNPAIWQFTEALLQTLTEREAIRWVSPGDLCAGTR